MDSPQKPKEVYFFGTCLIDLFYPKAGLSAIQLIEREQVKVIYPQDQTCCGQPAFNSGFRDEARTVALQQIRCFPKKIPIVIPSGSCSAMMKYHYKQLFEGHPAYQEVCQFSERVIEFSQFLVNVLQVQLTDIGEPTEVTLHVACHGLREMHVKDEPKQLLSQLKNVTLKELSKETECCGFGGTFAVKHSKISTAMLDDKIADITQTGTRYVLSGDCGCLMHIEGGLKFKKQAIEGQHLASFLWERTNG